jgi:G3E family GTPase
MLCSLRWVCRDLPDKVRLDGIVTVVDAKHVSRHLDEVEADPEKVSEAVEQVGAAALCA